ncbi:hypothetical protein BD414DRAFT_436949 [Trametes punicea]|nr:hypothetical protein BD414DRAFT_436949 [Trametes punicea]
MWQEPYSTGDESHPLTHPTYFASPVNTLVASVDDALSEEIAVHDLLDAYSTFSLRITAVAALLSQEGDLPALQYIQENAAIIGRCIRRDIRRSLVGPPGVANSDALTSLQSSTSRISEEQLYAANSVYILCQHSLQLASNIFAFRALYQLFPRNVLNQLLDDILIITQLSELQTPNDAKTRASAASVLATLQIPAEVVEASKMAIQEVLKDLALTMSPHLRACDIIHNMLSTYPLIFLPGSARLLPDILSKLVSTTPCVRMDSAVSLAGFALARLSFRSATTIPGVFEVQTAVHSFIRAQFPSSRTESKHQTPALLSEYIGRAAQEIITDASDHGPRWAIAVICCLIVLSGQGIFARRRPLRLVLDTVEVVARSRSPVAIDLVACVWKCLVWAFLHVSRDVASGQSTTDQRPRLAQSNSREVVFNIVKQELRGGVGACLVAGLLCDQNGRACSHPRLIAHPDLDWAISVLKDMTTHSSSSVYQDGVALLGRLVGGIGTSPQSPRASAEPDGWTLNDVVVQPLFLRHTLRADVKTFSAALHSANRFEPSHIVPLNEAELLNHWDRLMEIWIMSVKRELRKPDMTFSLPDALTHTWQALLLVQTQLTQEKGHLTTTPDFTTRVVSIVVDFLKFEPWPAAGPTTPSSAHAAQYCVLILCYRLWMIMRHVFAESWLCAASESLLSAVLQRTFDLSDERIRSSWSQLCSVLVSAGAPQLIARLVVEKEEERLVDTKRELWRALAKEWASRTPRPNWQDCVDFLAIPLRCWSMNERETEAWVMILEDALAKTCLISESHSCIFDALVERLDEDAAPARMLDVAPLILHMLSRLRLAEGAKQPVRFLRCIDTLLFQLYCELPERVSMALQMLQHLRHIINDCPVDAVVGLLTELSKGLAVWIGDEKELLLNTEYNEVVIPIYCDALHAVQAVTITPEILSSLANLLYSAFIRMPDPGYGPLAFYEFWAHIQPALQDTRGQYPEQIKTILRACRDVFGKISSQDPSFDTELRSGSQAEDSSEAHASPGSSALTPRSAASIRSRLQELQNSPIGTSRWHNHAPTTSPEIPYQPTTPRTSDVHASRLLEPRRNPTRLTRSKASISRYMPSDLMPSSPTDALRGRRLAAGATSRIAHERVSTPMDRPRKRQRMDTVPRTSQPLANVMIVGLEESPTPAQRRSSVRRKRQVAEAEDEPGEGDSSRMSRRRSITPWRGKVKGKGVVTPSVQAGAMASLLSEDYDAWEAPICEDDVPQLSERYDIVSDSQPSDAEGDDDDDSILPSFMKTTGKVGGGAPCGDMFDNFREDTDEVDLPDAELSPSQRRRARRATPLRTHTAPASLQHSQSSPEPVPEGPPLRRARTASAQLEELRNVYDALREEGSQLAVGEIAAASELTNKLGAMLSEKLSRRLRQESGDGRRKKIGKAEGKERRV